MMSYWSRWGPQSRIGVFIRREDTQKKGRKHHEKAQIQGEYHVTTEAEMVLT